MKALTLLNGGVVLLYALKETCALHCLHALRLAGPLPVTQQMVMHTTGFDEAAVQKGLDRLRAMGLVAGTGAGRQATWQLTPAADDALALLNGHATGGRAEVPAPAMDPAAQTPAPSMTAQTAPARGDAAPPSADDITGTAYPVDAPPETPAVIASTAESNSAGAPSNYPTQPAAIDPAPTPVNVESVPYYLWFGQFPTGNLKMR